MIARLNSVSNDALNSEKSIDDNANFDKISVTCETEINYYEVREEGDPFRKEQNLDPLDYDQKENIINKISGMLLEADENDLPPEMNDELRNLIARNIDIFALHFHLPTARVTPLQILPTDDAKPVLVSVRNYLRNSMSFWSALYCR